MTKLTMRYPILEFDPAPEALIEPSQQNKPRDMPEHAVICFFQEVIDRVVQTHKARVLVENRWEDGPHTEYRFFGKLSLQSLPFTV